VLDFLLQAVAEEVGHRVGAVGAIEQAIEGGGITHVPLDQLDARGLPRARAVRVARQPAHAPAVRDQVTRRGAALTPRDAGDRDEPGGRLGHARSLY
jgi:hypothetical protein